MCEYWILFYDGCAEQLCTNSTGMRLQAMEYVTLYRLGTGDVWKISSQSSSLSPSTSDMLLLPQLLQLYHTLLIELTSRLFVFLMKKKLKNQNNWLANSSYLM